MPQGSSQATLNVLYYIEPARWFSFFDLTEDGKITNYHTKYGDEIMSEFID